MTATSRILILGATGGTGQQLVVQALSRGHDVTAFVRDPQRLHMMHDHLRVVTGDVTTDSETLAAAIHGQDAVISALGVGNSLKSAGLISKCVPAIVHAMERESVRRLIFISAYGVGVTLRDVPFVSRMMIRLLLRDLYADKHSGEEELRRSGVDWTLVYPTTLTNKPKTGRWRVGERLELKGLPRISRADVADFILTHLDDNQYPKRGVLISS